MDDRLCVLCEDALLLEAANAFAEEMGVKCMRFDDEERIDTNLMEAHYVVHFNSQGCKLSWLEGKRRVFLYVDFVSGAKAHRRKFGGGKGQAIAKAVGVQSKFKPTILDCTAGQGSDAFVFASLGCEVVMLERSPIAHLLLTDALTRARSYAEEDDQALKDVMTRLCLLRSSAHDILSGENHVIYEGHALKRFDVIYLDPMFPARKKSALVKKEMRAFHDLIGKDTDADELLELALKHAVYRVVVKRPKGAPFLKDIAPTYQLAGKSTRFDIYTIKSMT